MFASLAIRLFCVCTTVCRGRRGGCKMGRHKAVIHHVVHLVAEWRHSRLGTTFLVVFWGCRHVDFSWYIVVWRLQVLARAKEEDRALHLDFSLLVAYCFRTNDWEEMKLEISWAFIIFDEMTTTPVPCSHHSCCFLLFFGNIIFLHVKSIVQCKLFSYK